MGTQPDGSAQSSDDQRPSPSWPAADAAPSDGDAGSDRPPLCEPADICAVQPTKRLFCALLHCPEASSDNASACLAALQTALQEVERRGVRIQKLEAEVVWYRTWADTYWQQLQHMSAAAAAFNQQHMRALSNQNQQMAAFTQYQMHVNAAAQLGKPAGASLPGLQVEHLPMQMIGKVSCLQF